VKDFIHEGEKRSLLNVKQAQTRVTPENINIIYTTIIENYHHQTIHVAPLKLELDTFDMNNTSPNSNQNIFLDNILEETESKLSEYVSSPNNPHNAHDVSLQRHSQINIADPFEMKLFSDDLRKEKARLNTKLNTHSTIRHMSKTQSTGSFKTSLNNIKTINDANKRTMKILMRQSFSSNNNSHTFMDLKAHLQEKSIKQLSVDALKNERKASLPSMNNTMCSAMTSMLLKSAQKITRDRQKSIPTSDLYVHSLTPNISPTSSRRGSLVTGVQEFHMKNTASSTVGEGPNSFQRSIPPTPPILLFKESRAHSPSGFENNSKIIFGGNESEANIPDSPKILSKVLNVERITVTPRLLPKSRNGESRHVIQSLPASPTQNSIEEEEEFTNPAKAGFKISLSSLSRLKQQSSDTTQIETTTSRHSNMKKGASTSNITPFNNRSAINVVDDDNSKIVFETPELGRDSTSHSKRLISKSREGSPNSKSFKATSTEMFQVPISNIKLRIPANLDKISAKFNDQIPESSRILKEKLEKRLIVLSKTKYKSGGINEEGKHTTDYNLDNMHSMITTVAPSDYDHLAPVPQIKKINEKKDVSASRVAIHNYSQHEKEKRRQKSVAVFIDSEKLIQAKMVARSRHNLFRFRAGYESLSKSPIKS
jgi:hypothetical protein